MPPEISRTNKTELRELYYRLAGTRARMMTARAGAGIAGAASVAIGIFAAEMTLDWLVHLPWIARACFSLPALGGAVWILYREVLAPLLRMPSDHAVACEIERAMPVFQTRLIASIQLGRDDAAKKSALVGALIRETAALAATQDFRKAVKFGKLALRLRALGSVLVVAGVLAWMGRADAMLLLERALLLTARLPTRTRIEKIDASAQIAAGEDLRIEVQAAGAIPNDGKIVAESGGRKSEYKLERDSPGTRSFHTVIRSVPESLSFRVFLNDAATDPVSVTVLAPPAVLGIECTEVYPAYTGLAPVARPTGDLSLLAGSVLQLSISASAALKEGAVHLTGIEKDLPLSVDARNRLLARAEIPIPKVGLTGFSIQLVDENGIASRETAVYRIDILPDRPPTIKLTHPDPDEAATPGATELIAFEASDDFGVAKVNLHYIVNHGDEKVINLDLGGAIPKDLARRFEWNLAALKLGPGGLIEYWMEAIDANDVTGPGRGVTDRARLKIVSEAEKRAELAERANDALSSLDQVGQSEDDLARKLGTLIFQTPDAGNP